MNATQTNGIRVTVIRGEHTTFTPSGCVPRAHVRVRSGHYRIFGAWTFDGLPDEFQPRWAWE